MVGRAFVAEVVSPADTGGGHRFHSAGGTSDDGRVAWRSVSRLQIAKIRASPSLVRRVCPCGRFDQFEERARPVGIWRSQ